METDKLTNMETKHLTAKEIEAVVKAAEKCLLSATIYDFPSAFKNGAEFLAKLRSEEKPSEDLKQQIIRIFEANQAESECPEWDTCIPFKSVQQYSYDAVASEIANLIQKQDVNAEMVPKNEMFEFAAWILCLLDTDIISLAKPMSEYYKDFQSVEKQSKK